MGEIVLKTLLFRLEVFQVKPRNQTILFSGTHNSARCIVIAESLWRSASKNASPHQPAQLAAGIITANITLPSASCNRFLKIISKKWRSRPRVSVHATCGSSEGGQGLSLFHNAQIRNLHFNDVRRIMPQTARPL
jgi:hypothetical protein